MSVQKIILSTVLSILPLLGMAQDDLYFIPKKSDKGAKSSYNQVDEQPASAGSMRDVDEYNRFTKLKKSYFEKIGTDSLGNDIIEFHADGDNVADTIKVYPGTIVDYEYDPSEDYRYSNRLSRFDDWYVYDPWLYGFYGYSPYWRARYGYWDWGWYNSWYPWYDSWWGYGYPYYSWGSYGYWPYSYWNYYPAVVYYAANSRHSGYAGTANHGFTSRSGHGSRSTVTAGRGSFGGYRGDGQTTRSYQRSNDRGLGARGSFGGSRTSGVATYQGSRSSNSSVPHAPVNSSSSFGGSRSSSSSSFGGSRSSSSGSFGGSTGGGSFGGGSHGGGGSRGGSFGGRR